MESCLGEVLKRGSALGSVTLWDWCPSRQAPFPEISHMAFFVQKLTVLLPATPNACYALPQQLKGSRLAFSSFLCLREL